MKVKDYGFKETYGECIESQMQSCFIDIAGITLEYVYRKWGGGDAIKEIKNGFAELRKYGHTESLKGGVM